MPRKVRTVRRMLTSTDVEELYERFESALLNGDQKRTEAAGTRLWELGQESSIPAEAITRKLIEGRTRVPVMAFTLLEAVAGKRDYFQADGLHPTADAEPLILNTVWNELRGMLKP